MSDLFLMANQSSWDHGITFFHEQDVRITLDDTTFKVGVLFPVLAGIVLHN